MKRDQWEDYTVTFTDMHQTTRTDAIPMYSYGRVSANFWNAFMNGLMDAGFSERAAIEWLRSKAARWALDGKLGDKLETLAFEFAKQHAEEYATRKDCDKWARETVNQ